MKKTRMDVILLVRLFRVLGRALYCYMQRVARKSRHLIRERTRACSGRKIRFVRENRRLIINNIPDHRIESWKKPEMFLREFPSRYRLSHVVRPTKGAFTTASCIGAVLFMKWACRLPVTILVYLGIANTNVNIQ